MTEKKLWLNRNVLVTGCTGLLGSWLCQELIRRGARVAGLVRDGVFDSRLHSENIAEKMVVVNGAVEDYHAMERIMNEYEIATVFHLAAQTIVGTANRNPMSTFAANIQGTWNILEAARRNPTVKSVIVASSDKAYGPQTNLPYMEDAPMQGCHPYDVSKSCADLIARSYHKTYGLPVCVTRCGNFFGGGDLNFNRIVPGSLRSIYAGERPIIRSDGTFIRDYIYIKDAVEAYLFLAEKMLSLDIHGEAFNFSNEIQLTVVDLVNLILKTAKREDLKPMIMNEASNEIPHQYLSAAKAKSVLGWLPKYSMEDAMRETAEWYAAYFEKAARSGGPV